MLWLAKFVVPVVRRKRVVVAAAEDDDEAAPLSKEEYSKMVLMMGDGAAQNHYELLGLGEQNINATEEAVRRAYRKLILRYHPDKVGGSATSDPLFLAIQKAYDVLSNTERRRLFDSQFEFDDSIPEVGKKGDFFALFGPVFERNARFSDVKPVPLLGALDEHGDGLDGAAVDEAEDFAPVLEFYKFWENFRSWRDFSGEGEHSVDEAESREEKRWMELQNSAEARKMKEKEVEGSEAGPSPPTCRSKYRSMVGV